MVGEDKVQKAARFLHEAHQTRAQYEPIPDDIAPRDISEAYDIQEAFHELLIPERGSIVGYKVALTTSVMQNMGLQVKNNANGKKRPFNVVSNKDTNVGIN